MKLLLPNELYQNIVSHLCSTYPNEGGGFLVGKIHQDEQRVVEEIYPVENTFAEQEQFHRFLAESSAYQQIEDMADARGLTLLGYYHSHPNVAAVPSEYDRIHAWPFFAYLIVSIRNNQAVEERLWQLSQDRKSFIEGELLFI